jgi:8-amino-7-oxononanoate synthase
LATIRFAYDELLNVSSNAELDLASHLNFPQKKLRSVIQYFLSEVKRIGFPVFPSGEMSERQWGFISSNSSIHCCVISGNQNVKEISQQLQQKGFDVKAVLSPTVPKGKERLRFCLHSYNSKEEITQVLDLLSSLTKM